ncbi:MAG: hypothetical protein M3394_02310 [Actinomycetota bacterium]|nr:hypothetical protein [Actinomycetota bacterium]
MTAPRLAAGAAVSAAVFAGTSTVLVRRDLLGCGDGLDSLGCLLAAVYLGLFAALVVAAVAGAVVLHRGGVPRAGLVAVFAAAAVGVSWVLVRALTSTTVLLWLGMALAFFVGNVAFHALFNLAPLPLPAAVGIGVALVVLSYGPMSQVSRRVDEARAEQKEQEQVEEAGFPVYIPTRLPPGYRSDEGNLYPDDGVTMRAHYTASYTYGGNVSGDPPPLQVHSFPATPAYRPPADCGPDVPQHKPWPRALPCTLVGTTPDGRQVFFSAPELTNTRHWFTRVGDIQVVASTTQSDAMPSHAQMVDLLASLAPAGPDQLRDL